jgi:beta-glucosidase-like glycosyl hydrolase/CubicO group peptidase (beta-lactamase class C family)
VNLLYIMVKLLFTKSVAALMLLTVTGISAGPEEAPVPSKRYFAMPVTSEESRWVDSVMNTLTPRERIAQLFMMPAYSNLDDNHTSNIRYSITRYKIGGLIFFQGTPEKQAELTNMYQAASSVPLLIGMDAEWGVGMRLKDVLSFPKQMALGAISNEALLHELGREFARQCKLLGVHINFAPDVDVNNNPANPVINYRSFGENRHNVARKGIALMGGMQAGGLMCCAKHFPGHGDTDVDSHFALPELSHSRERLDSLELRPFDDMIKAGVELVMVGHLFVKSLEDEGRTVPSSISKNVIDGLLRREMDFQGLIISDALNMKGLADNAGGANITVEALKAGHDILLMPDAVSKNLDAIEAAVSKGDLDREELERRCRKVLTAKYRAGLSVAPKPLETKGLTAKLNSPEAYALKNRLTEASITLIHNKNNLIPFKDIDKHRFGYLAVGGTKLGAVFGERLSLYADFVSASVSKAPTAVEIAAAEQKLADCDVVVVGYHSTATNPRQDFGLNSAVMEFIARLGKTKSVALNYFGSPYFLSRISETPSRYCGAITVGYDNSDESQDRTAQLLFGGIPFTAKLPVTPSPEFPEGYGIETYKSIRLSYVVPEEVGLSSKSLEGIDSLAQMAIARHAAPGCQILAARRGKVFYRKVFGHHTYSKATPVRFSDVYDLASMTKTSATLPLVMRMVDEGKLDLDKGLKNYVVLHQNSDKGKLKVRDILLHQAGLRAWIPFYLDFFTTPDKSPAIGRKSAKYGVQLPGTHRYLHNSYRLDPKLFASRRSEAYNQAVADGLFASIKAREEVYKSMDTSNLMSNVYRYSDLGFLYLQRILETAYGASEDKLLQAGFLEPLGMYSTGYLPLSKIDKSRIPPTEDDKIFRKQLVSGYVHDPGAALLGGVAGHAGLFGNVDDLAKLYQMYLNGGSYGERDYLRAETLSEFTSCISCRTGNRRGLGFDKQEPDPKKSSPVCKEASLSSYGHLGFTGTIVWVDPDRELIYIFLSNRVYPSAENSTLSSLGTRSEILARLLREIDKIN